MYGQAGRRALKKLGVETQGLTLKQRSYDTTTSPATPAPAKPSKYRNKRTQCNDGSWHQSKKEAQYCTNLQLRQKAGDIKFFLQQVPFRLPGGVKYLLDFLVVYPGGRIEYLDIKGYKTPMYLLKKKQVEAIYGIEIEEV
jgi:hypothetical protein